MIPDELKGTFNRFFLFSTYDRETTKILDWGIKSTRSGYFERLTMAYLLLFEQNQHPYYFLLGAFLTWWSLVLEPAFFLKAITGACGSSLITSSAKPNFNNLANCRSLLGRGKDFPFTL